MEKSFPRGTDEIVRDSGRRQYRESRRRVPKCLSRSCASSSSMCPGRKAGRPLSVQRSMAEIGQESDGDDFKGGLAEIVRSSGRCLDSAPKIESRNTLCISLRVERRKQLWSTSARS